MKKIAITLSLFLTTVFSVCGQGFGGLGNGGNNTASPRNASGEVYYQINTTTAPPMPSAASYNFTSQTFRSLTPNWKTTPPSTFTNYWRVKYVVSETNIGGGTGVPQFESPTQSTGQTQATTSVNTGTVTGTIRDLTLEGGEADKKVLKSLRGEYVNDDFKSSDSVKAFNRKVNPLEYEFLREDDWVFSEFIWREIDAREKMNQAFIYPGVDNTGDQRFLSILLNSIKNDSVWAFDPVGEGDRFTKRIYYDDIAQRINGPKEKNFMIVIDSIMTVPNREDMFNLFNKVEDHVIEKTLRILMQHVTRTSYRSKYRIPTYGEFFIRLRRFIGDKIAIDDKQWFGAQRLRICYPCCAAGVVCI